MARSGDKLRGLKIVVAEDEERLADVLIDLIGLYGGREDNTFYRRGERGLAIVRGKQLERSETALLGEAAIHSVVNPLQGFTAAIHVYGGDFFGMPRSEWDPATLEERPYDVARARQVFKDANERWRAEAARLG